MSTPTISRQRRPISAGSASPGRDAAPQPRRSRPRADPRTGQQRRIQRRHAAEHRRLMALHRVQHRIRRRPIRQENGPAPPPPSETSCCCPAHRHGTPLPRKTSGHRHGSPAPARHRYPPSPAGCRARAARPSARRWSRTNTARTPPHRPAPPRSARPAHRRARNAPNPTCRASSIAAGAVPSGCATTIRRSPVTLCSTGSNGADQRRRDHHRIGAAVRQDIADHLVRSAAG